LSYRYLLAFTEPKLKNSKGTISLKWVPSKVNLCNENKSDKLGQIELLAWADAGKKIKGGKVMLSGAKFVTKWGQITM
jgi:hypothetical protein